MLMMIINGIVFLVAAAYVEGVRPGEFGVPLPLCFPFKVSLVILMLLSVESIWFAKYHEWLQPF